MSIRANALNLPLADESVDLCISSPPYFALRSYCDDGEHYAGQIGSEEAPREFLSALWAAMDECWRVLKPMGMAWINLGDKFAGSGGHNNAGISAKSTLAGNGHIGGGPKLKATRRSAPDRYNQDSGGARAKSLMGLPWAFALGCFLPDPYRTIIDPGDHPQWILRRDLIWHKTNCLPESVTDRPRSSHEYWFGFSKQGRYFASMDELRESSEVVFDAPKQGSRQAQAQAQGIHRFSERTNNPLGKLPGSVWAIPSEPLKVPEHLGIEHFAAFPQEWPRRLILGFSPKGICTICGEGLAPLVDKELVNVWHDKPLADTRYGATRGEHQHNRMGQEKAFGSTAATITGYACACETPGPTRPAVILDPFGGTGTVAMVARALGRVGVSIDLSMDYCRLAMWRIYESGHAAKSAQRTYAENQGSLLAALESEAL